MLDINLVEKNMVLNRWNFNPDNYGFSSIMVNARSMKVDVPKFAWYTIIATWFWVGFIPLMPGTLGSLAVYPLYNIILESAVATAEYSALTDVLTKLWAAFIACFLLGWVGISKFQEKTGTFDHKMVVMDEVVGMLFALALSFDWAYKVAPLINKFLGFTERNTAFLLIFIIFRYFDIRKPFFISTIDRNYKRPLGVLLDDVAAGAFTAGVIFIIYKISLYVPK
jgi:phosphatidylglycerophosphatase A